MILFENGIIKLDYHPATDILSVDMPTVNMVILPEVKHALELIIENVKNYDVKRLLIDARQTEVDISEELYAELISDFSRNLMTNRLQKVARLVTSSSVRENVVKKVYSENKLHLEFKSFTDVASAKEWLISRRDVKGNL